MQNGTTLSVMAAKSTVDGLACLCEAKRHNAKTYANLVQKLVEDLLAHGDDFLVERDQPHTCT